MPSCMSSFGYSALVRYFGWETRWPTTNMGRPSGVVAGSMRFRASTTKTEFRAARIMPMRARCARFASTKKRARSRRASRDTTIPSTASRSRFRRSTSRTWHVLLTVSPNLLSSWAPRRERTESRNCRHCRVARHSHFPDELEGSGDVVHVSGLGGAVQAHCSRHLQAERRN